MSPLPEKGDVERAVKIWNARLEAITGDSDMGKAHDIGDLTFTEDSIEGEGAAHMRLMFHDLFDLAEMMSEAGQDTMRIATARLVSGESDLMSELAMVFLAGAGLGVLIERGRS